MTAANPNPTMNYNSPDAHASTTNPVLIIAAWLLVGLPLAWGVSQTFLKSLDLFRAPAARAAAGATMPAPAPTLPNAAPQPTTTPTKP